MEGMGLKLTPVVVRHLLGPLSLLGPMDITVVVKKLLKIQQC